MRTAVLISLISIFLLACSESKDDSVSPSVSPEAAPYTAAELRSVVMPGAQPTSIGVWEDTRPFMMLRFEIVDMGEAKFALVARGLKAAGGQRQIAQLREITIAAGRRFDRTDSIHGDHYILSPSGTVEIWDQEGLISTHENLLAE